MNHTAERSGERVKTPGKDCRISPKSTSFQAGAVTVTPVWLKSTALNAGGEYAICYGIVAVNEVNAIGPPATIEVVGI